jgi:hypothetical protein
VGEVFLNIWALITTEGKTVEEWKLDPLKVFAMLFFAAALILVFATTTLAFSAKPDIGIVGVIGGLVVPTGGFGSYLFGQAVDNDAGIRNQGNPPAGLGS